MMLHDQRGDDIWRVASGSERWIAAAVHQSYSPPKKSAAPAMPTPPVNTVWFTILTLDFINRNTLPKFPAMLRLTVLFLTVFTLNAVYGQDPVPVPQIKEIKQITPKELAFRDATRTKPVVIADKKTATNYFEKKELAKLLKSVDLKKQVIFVFAWRGSGQDEMSFTLKKSKPPQVEFEYRPGRTRDLRPHSKVYVISNDVLWNGKPVRASIRNSAGSK